MAIWQSHLNLQQVWNLQYHIYACYFVHFFTASYYTRRQKGVKYVSLSVKGFLRYLRWNYTASKRVSCVRTTHKEDNIFTWCCFDENSSSELAYTSWHAAVCDIYTFCYIFEKKTGDVITFAQFEEGNLLSETRNDAESGDESDDN